MNHSPSDPQPNAGLAFVEKTLNLSPDWGPASIADLASASATRSALIAALNRLPEADPGDKAVASAHGLVWDMVDEAECFILDQEPTSAHEAAVILDVLLDGEPQRSDGRDHDALRRIRDLLRSDSRMA